MNGPHDVGGQHGFGAVQPDPDDEPFHAPWEPRLFALTLAMGATGAWNLDQSRAAREAIGQVRYRNSSYYQIWLEGMIALLRERGLVTDDELRTGKALAPPVKLPRRLAADRVPAAMAAGAPTERQVGGMRAFVDGDRVRTRNLQPPTHIRLPAYIRDKPGVVVRCHGAHVLADTHAQREPDEAPQWLYSVRFEAADLFGPFTSAEAVYVDCWESYLERA